MTKKRAKAAAQGKMARGDNDQNISARVPEGLKGYLRRWADNAPGGMSEAAAVRLASEIFRDMTLELGPEWWPELLARAGGSKRTIGEFIGDALKGHLDQLRRGKK